MTATKTVCSECDTVPSSVTQYCPDCGAEEPWEKEPLYDFDDVELPIVVEYEHYNDTYGLWRAFCQQAFGGEVELEDVANYDGPSPRDMKYCVINTYWVVDKSGVDGPYLDRSEARSEL